MRRPGVVAFVAVAVLSVAMPAIVARSAPPRPRLLTCYPRRTATAHFAGGASLRPQPRIRPIPCGGTTGFAGAESHIVALPSGEVVFTPAVAPAGFLGIGSPSIPLQPNTQSNASPAGLAITTDKGEQWSFVKPSGATWNPTDHGDFVDRTTGRLFFEDYGPIPLAPAFGPDQEGPAHINWSQDAGRTWHHTAITTVFLPENPRFTAAKAPRGQPPPVGYPNVVYFCTNTNVGFTSPAIAGRLCFRSLDGGDTWEQRSILFSGLLPQHAECGGNGEQYSAIDGNYPQPAKDGSLYVMVTCGGVTYLARSIDEAGSFPIIYVGGKPLTVPAPAPGVGLNLGLSDLRIGPDDLMYLMYEASTSSGQALMLRVSRDFGRTWSKAWNVTAPGVSDQFQWALAVGGPGHVAVAYLGQAEGQQTWDAWVTETRNAGRAFTQRGPLFYSGRVNDPDRPLLFGNGIKGSGYLRLGPGANVLFPFPFNNQMAGNDFIGATIAADGTPWGSFTQDCGPDPESPGCQAQNGQTRGFAGYLNWPRSRNASSR